TVLQSSALTSHYCLIVDIFRFFLKTLNIMIILIHCSPISNKKFKGTHPMHRKLLNRKYAMFHC
ncbi:MAG: hypothetical protein QXM89_05540, partial [Candidatus Bathyarchaeia archaeon]